MDHGNPCRIAATVPVMLHDAGIHLRCRGHAERAPVGEPLEEDDAPREVREPDRLPGGAIGEGELVDEVPDGVTGLAQRGGQGGQEPQHGGHGPSTTDGAGDVHGVSGIGGRDFGEQGPGTKR